MPLSVSTVCSLPSTNLVMQNSLRERADCAYCVEAVPFQEYIRKSILSKSFSANITQVDKQAHTFFNQFLQE